MKTSNKLLLGSVLFAFLMLCVVHLALYAKFKSGKIETAKDRGMESLILPGETSPSVVSIKGSLNIQAEPSDSFSLNAEIRSDVQIERRRSGDTLFLMGDTSRHFNMHFPWQVYFAMQRINLHCGRVRTLIVSDGMAVLKGQDRPGGAPFDLKITNGQAWVGLPYENFDPPKRLWFFDSLHIDESGANLTLQNNASIRSLDCQLDDESEFVDLHATIEKPQIHYTAHSRLNLTGSNFKKLQVAP